MTDQNPRARLATRLSPRRHESGIRTLERLHTRVRALLSGTLRTAQEDGNNGYAGWYIHLRTPGLDAIASEGWVERHLSDVALLAESSELAECCRSTALQLFGAESFHVAIQHYPDSDGLVRSLCHEPGDRLQRVRRIAGELTWLRSAYGSYPPPGLGLESAVSIDLPAFDAIPVG